MPNNTIWCVTGNNLKFGDDLVRRFIRIVLFFAEEPEKRDDFTHKNLNRYVADNRPQLLAALLTIIRAWYARGCPKAPNERLLGSYEEWCSTVGGILYTAGVTGFLENMNDRHEESNSETAQWSTFLTACFSLNLDRPFTVAALTSLIDMDKYCGRGADGETLLSALPDHVLNKAKKRGGGLGNPLGSAFKQISNSVYSGLVLEQAGKDKTLNTATWRITVCHPEKLPERSLAAYRALTYLRAGASPDRR